MATWWETIKAYTTDQLTNITDNVTAADESYWNDNSSKHLKSIIDLLQGLKDATNDRLIWGAQYDSIHDAIADVPTGGGCVVLTPGTYNLSGTTATLATDKTSILGLGFGAVITNTGARCDGFRITGDEINFLGNFKIDGETSYLVDRGVIWVGAKYWNIHGLYTYRCYREGMRFDYSGSDYTKENMISDCLLRDCGQDDAAPNLTLNVCDNNYFSNCYFTGGNGSRNIYLVQSDGCNFSGCSISGGGSSQQIELVSDTYGALFSGCQIGGAKGHGILLSNAPNNSFVGCTIHWAGQLGTNVYDNVRLSGSAHGNKFIGCDIFGVKEPRRTPLETPVYSKYGVNIYSGVTETRILGCDIREHATDDVNDSGSATDWSH